MQMRYTLNSCKFLGVTTLAFTDVCGTLTKEPRWDANAMRLTPQAASN